MSSTAEIVPQSHNWLSSKLLGAEIQPIPDEQPPSSIERNYLSRITFSWLDRILRVGYDRLLVLQDLPKAAKRDSIEPKLAEYHKYLESHPGEKDYTEVWGLLYAFRKTIVLVSILQALAYGANISQSVVSRKLIEVTAKIEAANGHGLRGSAAGYTVANTVLNIVGLVGMLFASYNSQIMSRQMRVLAMTAIHEKVLTLCPQQRMDFSAGKITSILSSDTTRGAMVTLYVSEIIIFPFYLAAVIGVLIYYIGVSALAGIALLLVALAFNMWGAYYAGRLRLKSVPFQDKRVSMTRETVKNMSIVKFYGWENSFLRAIGKIRAAEAVLIRRIALVTSLTNSIIIGAPSYAGALAFAVRIIIGKTLKPAEAFPSLSLFSMFLPIFATMTIAITTFADAWVACKRTNELFRLPSIPSYIETLNGNDPANRHLAFRLTDVTLAWDVIDTEPVQGSHNESASSIDSQSASEQEKPAKASATKISREILTDVSLVIGSGTMNIVVGPVGSGKTSLLSSFMSDIPLKNGSVAKAADQKVSSVLSHWSRNATIRDNILFGKPLDHRLYESVLRACDLHSDLAMFSDGDFTEVGENGVTLSGGQRARLALARCLYADSDIMILDDVLSAMDARVGNLIFKELLKLVHLKGKTIVFATNNLANVPYAETIISMDGKGGCKQIKQENAMKLDFDLEFPIAEDFESSPSSEDEDAEKSSLRDSSIKPAHIGEDNESSYRDSKIRAAILIQPKMPPTDATLAIGEMSELVSISGQNKQAGVLMADENKATGSVDLTVIIRFFKLQSPLGIVLALCALTVAAAYGTASGMMNVVLNWWTSDKFKKSQGFNIGMYCLVAGVNTGAYVCFANIIAYYCTSSTSSLFGRALRGVYGAPMVFFQQNPLGRIMTRFTEDVVNLDTLLLMFSRAFFLLAMSFLGNVMVIFVYVPWSIICLAPIAIFSLLFLAFYRTASRDLNRLKQLCESKLMTLVSENVEGQDVISAFGQEDAAKALMLVRANQLISAVMCNDGSHFWMALRDAVACEILTIVTIFLAVFQVLRLNSSEVGMIVTTLSSVTMSLLETFPVFANWENQLNSVERLDEYALHTQGEENLSEEAATDSRVKDWTVSKGTITFQNVSLRYREDLPLALNNLSFEIGGGKRLGICGRTGAGKSTIISALFRLTGLSSGQIRIDDQPIEDLPLNTLRQGLTIIPQQPVLFQGTIRSNLDPFEEHTDEELWNALNRAGGLNNRNGAKFHLDSKVSADGTNFSLGERQMLSLARAVVRGTKILVMDEATAAVDEEMDQKIQEIIRTQFKTCTVICIAHRLKTIMDYDEIMVMGAGGVLIEKDTPHALLHAGGEFAALAIESGII